MTPEEARLLVAEIGQELRETPRWRWRRRRRLQRARRYAKAALFGLLYGGAERLEPWQEELAREWPDGGIAVTAMPRKRPLGKYGGVDLPPSPSQEPGFMEPGDGGMRRSDFPGTGP